MGPKFDPIPPVEAWQLSNPPIFQLAALRSSLELFERATMDAIIAKRDRLTRYLEQLLQRECSRSMLHHHPHLGGWPANSRGHAMHSLGVHFPYEFPYYS